jgi:hypothetical protein
VLPRGAGRVDRLLVVRAQPLPKTHNAKEALIELYTHLHGGDPPTLDNRRHLLASLLFNPQHYSLARHHHAPYGNCLFLRLRGQRDS